MQKLLHGPHNIDIAVQYACMTTQHRHHCTIWHKAVFKQQSGPDMPMPGTPTQVPRLLLLWCLRFQTGPLLKPARLPYSFQHHILAYAHAYNSCASICTRCDIAHVAVATRKVCRSTVPHSMRFQSGVAGSIPCTWNHSAEPHCWCPHQSRTGEPEQGGSLLLHNTSPACLQ